MSATVYSVPSPDVLTGSTIIHITKKEGDNVQIVPEGIPGATVLAVKRVNELDYYSLGLHDLAEKVGLGPNKALAVVKHMKLQGSGDYFKVVKVGKAEFKRYSPKALDAMKKALPTLNIDEIWKVHRPKGRSNARS